MELVSEQVGVPRGVALDIHGASQTPAIMGSYRYHEMSQCNLINKSKLIFNDYSKVLLSKVLNR